MTNQANRISVCIVDDQALIRRGLQGILEHTANIQVIGQAQDGLEAIKLSLDQKPNVMLMDLEMPGMNGLDAAKIIFDKNQTIKIIMLTSVENPAFIQQAKKIGIRGYLLKSTPPQEIIEAIHKVNQGEYYFQTKGPLTQDPRTTAKPITLGQPSDTDIQA